MIGIGILAIRRSTNRVNLPKASLAMVILATMVVTLTTANPGTAVMAILATINLGTDNLATVSLATDNLATVNPTTGNLAMDITMVNPLTDSQAQVILATTHPATNNPAAVFLATANPTTVNFTPIVSDIFSETRQRRGNGPPPRVHFFNVPRAVFLVFTLCTISRMHLIV